VACGLLLIALQAASMSFMGGALNIYALVSARKLLIEILSGIIVTKLSMPR
jgi:hypothetical protein